MNPAKISGACGRLMCCLKYEQEAYEDAHSRIPKLGAVVSTPEGQGVVEGINLLRETVTVRMDRGGVEDLLVFNVKEITFAKPAPKEACANSCSGKCPKKDAKKIDINREDSVIAAISDPPETPENKADS